MQTYLLKKQFKIRKLVLHTFHNIVHFFWDKIPISPLLSGAEGVLGGSEKAKTCTQN